MSKKYKKDRVAVYKLKRRILEDDIIKKLPSLFGIPASILFGENL